MIGFYALRPTLIRGFTSEYGDSTVVTKDHQLVWDDMPLVAQRNIGLWDDGVTAKKAHQATWNIRPLVSNGHTAPYAGVFPVGAYDDAGYSLLEINPVQKGHSSFYSLISSGSDMPDSGIILRYVDTLEPIEIVNATVESDDGDLFWTANFTVADYAEYLAIRKGDLIELVLFGDVYRFYVDTKSIKRSNEPAPVMTISGVGPAAMYSKPVAAPITLTISEAQNASVVAEAMLGGTNIDWLMVDWTIPAYRVSVTDAVPIEAARTIVEAAGGLLDSTALGAFVARYKFTVSPRKIYDPEVIVHHILTDGEDNISLEESSLLGTYYDKVRVSDSNVTQSDKITFKLDEGYTDRGILEVTPYPWRTNLRVVHTCGDEVYLDNMGIVQHTVSEVVEFTFGAATTSEPVLAIVSMQWLSVALGGVVFDPRSSALKTSTAINGGFGVLSITYVSEHIEYHTEAPNGGVVQYLVEETTGD
jgi:hypothetical protein